MPRDGFLVASKLLQEASERVEEAARAVIREAARANVLVTPMDQDYTRARVQGPDEMNADALTKVANEMAHTASTLHNFSNGFAGEGAA